MSAFRGRMQDQASARCVHSMPLYLCKYSIRFTEPIAMLTNGLIHCSDLECKPWVAHV